MNITELKKLMMKSKKENPEKATILMMLVDLSLKQAKAEKAEVSENHIIEAARKMLKIAREEKEFGVEGAEREIEILQEFLPKMLDENETEKIIRELVEKYNGKDYSKIMPELKKRGDIDFKLAGKILKNI